MGAVRTVAVGTNFITDRFLEACRRVDEIELVGILSRTRARAEEYAATWQIPVPYWSEDAVLSDPTVDALYIATPNRAHFALARRAIESGKHVLIEKCITETHAQFCELRALAEERGVVMLEAMRPDFDAAHTALAENLARIGRPRRASLEFCQYSSRYDAFLRGEVLRAFDPSIGNCALADIGIYPLHVAVALFGSPISVHAQSLFLSNGFEGMGRATLGYPDGFFADIVYSKITSGCRPSVIEGEQGSLTIDHISIPTRVEWISRTGEREVLYAADAPFDAMGEEVRAFCRMVTGDLCTRAYLDRTDRTMRVYDAIVRTSGIFSR